MTETKNKTIEFQFENVPQSQKPKIEKIPAIPKENLSIGLTKYEKTYITKAEKNSLIFQEGILLVLTAIFIFQFFQKILTQKPKFYSSYLEIKKNYNFFQKVEKIPYAINYGCFYQKKYQYNYRLRCNTSLLILFIIFIEAYFFYKNVLSEPYPAINEESAYPVIVIAIFCTIMTTTFIIYPISMVAKFCDYLYQIYEKKVKATEIKILKRLKKIIIKIIISIFIGLCVLEMESVKNLEEIFINMIKVNNIFLGLYLLYAILQDIIINNFLPQIIIKQPIEFIKQSENTGLFIKDFKKTTHFKNYFFINFFKKNNLGIEYKRIIYHQYVQNFKTTKK